MPSGADPRPAINAANRPVAGIVLAAGHSRRMGRPKALLGTPDTWLARAVNALSEGGCEPVIAVVGPLATGEFAAIAAAARAAGAGVAENPHPDSEQIDSLRCGLRAVPAAAVAAVVTPVDLPGIRSEDVARLVAAFRRGGAPVVVPVFGGRHGHPVLFSRDVFAELLEQDLPDGARGIVHAHAATLAEVPVGHPAVLEDVNTPAQLGSLAPKPE